jgi:BRCT domain type II-containing protein
MYGGKVSGSVSKKTSYVLAGEEAGSIGVDFLKVAAAIPIHTEVQIFPLAEANRALNALKDDAIRGAAVLKIRE